MQQQKRGQANGRRGVAADGFGNDLRRQKSGKLPKNRWPQIVIRDDPKAMCRRERRQARHSLLDHGLLAVEREQLLGVAFPAQRPETRAPASGQNYGIEMWMFSHEVKL